MKCVSINGVKSFKIEERNTPKFDNGKVVFRVNSCGICGSDIHYWVSGGPVGLVMGHEFSGTVVEPGSRSDLKVGDRITALESSNSTQGLSIYNLYQISKILNVRIDKFFEGVD